VRAILTYHSIDDSRSPISCGREAFARHVAWLASGRVKVTTLETLVTLPESADAVAVTFDDGFDSFGAIAAPQLLAHGIPATIFVVTDHAGRTNAWHGTSERGIPDLSLLDWDALGSWRDKGFAIGSHTRTHVDLTTVGAARLEDELEGAASIIERRLGHRPASVAYPYGEIDAEAVRAARLVYRYGCTTELGPVGPTVDALRIPRLDAFYFQAPDAFEQWGSREFRRSLRVRRGLRATRRALRRARSRMLNWRPSNES
jgi:peptidoglycan/xylan/chitin deacetylase (PgdA/CDA1 family)